MKVNKKTLDNECIIFKKRTVTTKKKVEKKFKKNLKVLEDLMNWEDPIILDDYNISKQNKENKENKENQINQENQENQDNQDNRMEKFYSNVKRKKWTEIKYDYDNLLWDDDNISKSENQNEINNNDKNLIETKDIKDIKDNLELPKVTNIIINLDNINNTSINHNDQKQLNLTNNNIIINDNHNFYTNEKSIDKIMINLGKEEQDEKNDAINNDNLNDDTTIDNNNNDNDNEKNDEDDTYDYDDEYDEIDSDDSDENNKHFKNVELKKRKEKMIKSCTRCPIIFNGYGEEDGEVMFPSSYSVPDVLLEEICESMNLDNWPKCQLKPKKHINVRALSLKPLIVRFWNIRNLEFLCKILLKKVPITLTDIDWLCIGYSIEYPVKYSVIRDGKSVLIDVGKDHKQNLSMFNRKHFGAFCRHDRILIAFTSKELEQYLVPPKNDGNIYWVAKMIMGTRYINGRIHYYLITSVGQLLFFRWAFLNDVVKYCQDNIEEIHNHLLIAKGKPKEDGKRRRLTHPQIELPQVKNDPLKIMCNGNNLESL